ncbi:MAG: nucleotide sugar dehydrogenase [Methanoregulaceae archaeon]|nr:nucleotide sugar dehydrogenase [Methanoregulaceae archaeon]
MSNSSLLQRIQDRQAVVGILGLGYVGLPLAMRFVEAGYRVVGIDVDPKKVVALNARQSYIKHLGQARIAEMMDSGLMEPTTDFARCSECDALLICVPTPLGRHREPDLSFVVNTMESMMPYLREGQVISLESTTYPGTTEEEIVPRVESVGLKVGENAFVVFSPEREDPGNPNFTTRTIPKVVGGHTPPCLEVGVALYRAVIDQVVPVSSTKAAELTKILENVYRAVNIGLVNELKIVADRMGIDIWEVIDAAATKPFGFTPFYPGPGLGGHCIPIDPFYLTWKAHEYEMHTRFIELAGEINSGMPRWVVLKVGLALNEHGKSVKGSRVLILGIAYKKNIDDSRETPSAELIANLDQLGAEVDYSDPHVPVFPVKRRHRFDLASVELTPESIASYDCILLATDHDAFDYDLIKQHAKLIIDTRGRYREPAANVVKA